MKYFQHKDDSDRLLVKSDNGELFAHFGNERVNEDEINEDEWIEMK